MFKRLMMFLPLFVIGLVDWSIYVSVGKGRYGFTIGPCFITLDVDGDIWREFHLWTPKEGSRFYMSDRSFEWSSREGLNDQTYKSLA